MRSQAQVSRLMPMCRHVESLPSVPSVVWLNVPVKAVVGLVPMQCPGMGLWGMDWVMRVLKKLIHRGTSVLGYIRD